MGNAKDIEMYREEDLSNLNELDLSQLSNELQLRLQLDKRRLTHADFCAFRGALIRNPEVAAASDLDEEYRGIYQKVQDYLKDPSSKDHLARQTGCFPDCATVLQKLDSLNSDVNYDQFTTVEPELVTGAIIADCQYCLTWLYELDIIPSGYVAYNEHGWSLLGVAIKHNARNVIELLIKHSGGDPGPFQPYRIWKDGSMGQSFLKYASETRYPAPAHDDYYWSLLQWCDSFMEDGDQRIQTELDPMSQYNICLLSSVRVSNLLKDFGIDLTQTASGPTGKNIWHAAIVNENIVYLTWLKIAFPSAINVRDENGKTPLMDAIIQGKKQSVQWLLDALKTKEITSAGTCVEPLPSALDIAVESWNENCVIILRLIYTLPINEYTCPCPESTTKLILRIIKSLSARGKKIETRLGNNALSRTQRQALWKTAREQAGEKFKIILERAPAAFFQGAALQKCKRVAQQEGVGFLQHHLGTKMVTKKKLRSQRSEVLGGYLPAIGHWL